MPQFDISSFIVQLIWLFLTFLTFYFIFTFYYLPFWAFLLKFRKRFEKRYNLENISTLTKPIQDQEKTLFKLKKTSINKPLF